MLSKQKEEIKYVVLNSKYVTIAEDKLDSFLINFKSYDYVHWSRELDLKLNEEEWILLAFILESMNFCFWQEPKWRIDYHGKTMSGSSALFYSIFKAIENDIFSLDAEKLYNYSKEQLKKIFEPVNGEIPLFENRYQNFKEVIDIFYHDKNIYNELYSMKSDLELQNMIINKFHSFDDRSLYKGKEIHFNKRATLLVNDLFCLSSKIKNSIKNVDNLGGCADYGVPRLLRDYGILIYSEELQNLIDNKIEIEHNSEMEIEIRGNMLYVIELLKEKINKDKIIINSVELDNLIWKMYKNKQTQSNVHHTTTIYY